MKNKNMASFKLYFVCLLLVILGGLPACKKYLDVKTDKKLVIPATVDDAQALLDLYSLMNSNYPSLGNESDDNFYLLPAYFNSLIVGKADHHIWNPQALDESDWGFMYQMVLNANLAMETLAKQSAEINNTDRVRSIRGAALFFRAMGFYHVAQYYCQPYNSTTAASLPGIPLRLSSATEPVSTRATLEQSWQQIIADLKESVNLLPVNNTPLSRPSKTAACAALARVFLDMASYDSAGKYASAALQLNSTLMDYNTINETLTNPFPRFNPEVIFSSVTQLTGMHLVTNYRVDSLLYRSYDVNDRRKKLYFKSNGTGTFGFCGSYDGSNVPFNGLATDEMYLIKAECAARVGDKDTAMAALNTLLVTRWTKGTFVPFKATSNAQALQIILLERRKELIMRGSRWFDLRRLNQETGQSKTLVRLQNNTTYSLPPNDSRYTFLIPAKVIAITGMPQNSR